MTSPEIDEISDLPDRPHRKTDPLTAGSTFRGYSEASGDDFIPIQTEAGSIYRLKSSGFGSTLPYDPNHLQVVDANGNTLSTQQLYAEYLLIDAPEAGTYFVRLHANNRDISSHGLYEISFEEYDGHVTGTRKADWLPGSRLDEIVFARGGNDTVYGESGNDSLYGEKGHDNLSGGDGEDSLLGGAGSDTLHGGDDGDRLDGGAGQDRLDGSNGDDVLRGGAQSDFLLGGDGNDRLLGEQGNDRLAGGSGDDLLHGGNGRDLLNGLEGSDYIKGGNGNDTLNGNDGWDLLNGGEGSDVFVFDKPVSFEIDAIEKFSFSDDTILISSKGLRGRTAEDIASSARLVQGGEIIDIGPVGSAFLVEFDTSGLLINIKSDRYVFLIGETHTDQLSDVFDFF
ncbi:calcium-binding protein [Leisingera sp.]|uniref:calcium-binding protein n=1 Tax=Leisingera sp. TaxID=1879318 RepID=UPI003A9291CF